MVSVAATELKNNLGRFLSLVRAGQTVQVTDRGRPIGQIVPTGRSVEAVAHLADEARALSELERKGGIRWGSGGVSISHKPARLTKGRSSTAMIVEDRR